jgi:hypothetical protein
MIATFSPSSYVGSSLRLHQKILEKPPVLDCKKLLEECGIQKKVSNLTIKIQSHSTMRLIGEDDIHS